MLTVTHGVRVRSDARCAPRLSPSATMTSHGRSSKARTRSSDWAAAVRTKTCSTFASIWRGPLRPRSTGNVAARSYSSKSGADVHVSTPAPTAVNRSAWAEPV